MLYVIGRSLLQFQRSILFHLNACCVEQSTWYGKAVALISPLLSFQSGGIEFPEPLASMLTIITGQRWKDVRSIMSPGFTSGKLKNMMYIMNEAGDVLLRKIEKAAEEKIAVDIHE